MRLASDLNLPANVVTQKLAFLGRTGSGKTYAASKLAELMLDAGAQVIVLDAVGVWYGLRLDSDGKRAGISIPIFGGLHGDVPLEATGGHLAADLVVDRGISVILDVSQFEHDSAKARFAQDFGDRFFFRKKASPSAVHVFLEECQEFVPQEPQRGEERMLHAFQRIQKLGRNFGIGVSLISQRPQEVNKKALNQTECLFAFQMTGPQERKAIQGWIADKGLDEDIHGLLPKLDVGQAHVWSPQWLKVSKSIYIEAKRTFNASSTPEVGKVSKSRSLAPIDLEKIRTDMAATIERAKADDPRELRKTIADLRAAAGSHRCPTVTPKAGKVREVQVVKESTITRLEKIVVQMLDYGERTRELASKFQRFGEEVSAIVGASKHANAAAKIEPMPPPTITLRVPSIPASVRISKEISGALGRGERAVLTAIAQHEMGVTREQITILTGYKRSTRDAYIQRLAAAGNIEVHLDGSISATDDGVAVLGPNFQKLPIGRALLAHWLDRLPFGERAILSFLADEYPKAVDREKISEKTGFDKRSTRDAYIQRLTARRLAVRSGNGSVLAAQELFS